MRKALVLAGLLVVLVLATYGGPASVAAAQYCSVTCASGYKLECNGDCSANSGILTCCGQQYDCAAINAYSACWDACSDDYEECRTSGSGCRTQACLTACNNALYQCRQSCGAKPQISFSC